MQNNKNKSFVLATIILQAILLIFYAAFLDPTVANFNTSQSFLLTAIATLGNCI